MSSADLILKDLRKKAIKGGVLSKYSGSEGTQSFGISEIISLSREEAFGWCQEHKKIDAIEQCFSDLVEEA